uniref:Uncharacterized protein n=1 Tax=Arion vulgaris TaxID=1028688 RepID=A0A0B7ASF7_9EUPU
MTIYQDQMIIKYYIVKYCNCDGKEMPVECDTPEQNQKGPKFGRTGCYFL